MRGLAQSDRRVKVVAGRRRSVSSTRSPRFLLRAWRFPRALQRRAVTEFVEAWNFRSPTTRFNPPRSHWKSRILADGAV